MTDRRKRLWVVAGIVVAALTTGGVVVYLTNSIADSGHMPNRSAGPPAAETTPANPTIVPTVRQTNTTQPRVVPPDATPPESASYESGWNPREKEDLGFNTTSGYVFVGGLYLETPYVVSIRDRTVRVNSHIVYRLRERRRGIMPSGDNDPGVPDWVKPDTTLKRLISDDQGRPVGLPFQKWRYLTLAHPPQRAIKEMVAYLKDLPCIADAIRNSSITDEYYLVVIVRPKHGKQMALIFTPPEKEPRSSNQASPSTRQTSTSPSSQPFDKQADLEKMRNMIGGLLATNSAVFFFGESGPSITFGEELAARRLPLALSVLRSGRPRERRIEILKALGIYPKTERFVDGFKPSDQLKKRMQDLGKRTGIRPMTLEEIKRISSE